MLRVVSQWSIRTVGQKGQVVIAKEIRDRLGVRLGWQVVQRIVGNHVLMHFVPPASRSSLRGCLARHTKVRIGTTSSDWMKARDEAWRRAASRKVQRPVPGRLP